MSIITIIGSGVMGSAMSFPARENGHTVRLVGTKLDRDIIRHAKETNHHLTLDRKLPDGIEYYYLEDLPFLGNCTVRSIPAPSLT